MLRLFAGAGAGRKGAARSAAQTTTPPARCGAGGAIVELESAAQAGANSPWRRRATRSAEPRAPKPTIISAQLAGSGTTPA